MYQKQLKPQFRSLAHGLNMGRDQFLLYQEGGEQNLVCTAIITRIMYPGLTECVGAALGRKY